MQRTTMWSLVALSLAVAGCDDGEPADPGVEPQVIAACDVDIEIAEPNPQYPWTPNAIRLVSAELGDGVFAIYESEVEEKSAAGLPAATSGGFVIGERGVVMIETMINRQLFCQAVALIRAETDKPILYAVNTSYHGDHSYGNAWLPAEVQVVQHAGTAAFIDSHFEADLEFMEANFGADQDLDEATPRAADIEVGAEGHVIDLGGGVTVEARYQGFGQTEGDLFVYAPHANAMWTGNPLIAPAPAIPWLLDGRAAEVRDTMRRVQQGLLPGSRVVPGHGPLMTAEGFDFSIGYLDALLTEVQASIDAGLTLEETVEAVTLADFQGYALWGWVHAAVNVPATYAELSGE